MTAATKREEVILRVAGVGGSYAIFGEQHQGCWRYWHNAGGGDAWMLADEEASSPPVPGEPMSECEFDYINTLDLALEEINSDWPRLVPIEVHPAFANDIGVRVTRYLAENRVRSLLDVIARWREFCPVQEPIL